MRGSWCLQHDGLAAYGNSRSILKLRLLGKSSKEQIEKVQQSFTNTL